MTTTEATIKQGRLFGALADLGFDSIILTRRDNIAWISCGGEAVSARVSPFSPVYLVLTPEKRYAVGYFMDLPRTMDEALAGLGYEGVSLPTFGKTVEAAALELAPGRAACDSDLLGLVNIDHHLIRLYEPYTPEEMDRYRTLAAASSKILTELAHWVRPGQTERQIFAQMWKLYLDQGFEGHFMFVGADDRIARYRHPVPSDQPLEKVVLLAPSVTKWGLMSMSSRMVYFETPPEDIRRRFEALAEMQAALLVASQPGTPLPDLRQLIHENYAQRGFAEEYNLHFHGGPTGYRGSYLEPMADPAARVQANSAFVYYLTLTGAKTEDLILVAEEGAQFASHDPDWPALTVQYQDRQVSIPDILVRA